MRNLKRLHTAGIPSPEPHVLKSHVLVMEFLGNNGESLTIHDIIFLSFFAVLMDFGYNIASFQGGVHLG